MPRHNPIDLTRVQRLVDARVYSDALLSHKVYRVEVDRKPRVFVCKEAKHSTFAKVEVLAQEFFRLIIGAPQPETWLACNSMGVHYVLSEEIPGFHPIPFYRGREFPSGLGPILVTALFLEEVDLKNGNIGLNAMGQFVKIDGDLCFWEIHEQETEEKAKKQFNITQRTLNYLPYVNDFYAHNWLDLVERTVRRTQSRLVPQDLYNWAGFRDEVNQAILKICLLTDGFLAEFVFADHPSQAEKYFGFFSSRRQLLRMVALENESFKAYLFSDKAKTDVMSFHEHLTGFKVNGANCIVSPQDAPVLLDSMKSTFLSFRKSSRQYQELDRLLKEIYERRLDTQLSADRKTYEYINTVRASISEQMASQDSLKEHLKGAEQVLASLSSNEIVLVLEEIKTYRRTASAWTIGHHDKANRIEQALQELPLLERGTLLSGPKNPVQEALASHRYFTSRNAFFTQDSINPNRAAESFKRLKAKIEKQDAPLSIRK